MLRLKKNFPKAPILPKYLGSDPNEQGFAFVRNGMYEGRRNNINTLSRSLIDLQRSTSTTTTLMGLPIQGAAGLDSSNNPDQPMFYGEDIDLGEMLKHMEQGSKDCLADCRQFNLGLVDETSLSIAESDNVLTDEEALLATCGDTLEDI